MADWSMNDLRRLDVEFAKNGVPMHQRPFRAAVELLGMAFVIGTGGNPEVSAIEEAYAELVPEVRTNWPGAGIGIAVSVDRVRKLTLAVVFGTRLVEPWQVDGFSSAKEWWSWCREQGSIASEAAFAFADLHDFAHGLHAIEERYREARIKWRMAQSNLEDVANALPLAFRVDSIIQPICLVVELSLKGALIRDGAAPDSFRGKEGHNLADLAKRMVEARPHRDDTLVASVISKLPPYVESRYSPAGLTRLEVVRLALGVQFVAASTLRRITGIDLAAQMETGTAWLVPRRPFFDGSR